MQSIGSSTLLGQRIDQWLGELTTARRSPETLKSYRSDIRFVGAHLAETLDKEPADVDIADFTRENLIAAFERFSVDHSPASIRRAMATWGSLGRYMADITRDIQRNPVAMIRRPALPRRAPRLITDDDYPRKIMATAAAPSAGRSRWPARDVALMATYLLLGLRLTEAVIIRPKDIRRGETTTVLIHGKGSYERVLVVPPSLLTLWDDYMAAAAARFGALSPDTPMIRHASTGRPLSRQVAEALVDRIFREAGIRASIPQGALVHALRHGYATEALRSGSSLLDLRDHLGHSTIAVTDIYLHSDPHRRRQLVEEHPFVEQVQAGIAS